MYAWGNLETAPNGEQTFVVCCFLQFLYGEKPLSLGDLAALANTSTLTISCCHSGWRKCGIFGVIDLAGCFMSTWGRYVLAFSSLGTGNKETAIISAL